MNQHDNWKCLCGHLHRLKFRQIICPICRTECLVRESSIHHRLDEQASWLAHDYKDFTKECAIRLTLHTRWLIDQLKP
jgi:hypothetical protein